MGLFGSKESKEAAQEKKAQDLLNKYGLTTVSTEYAPMVKQVSYDLAGTAAMQFGGSLSGMKDGDVLNAALLNALIDQNWIIIKQLDDLNKKNR